MSQAKSKILILVTGGTFDKEYDEINGKLFFRDTHLEEMLKLGRSRLETRVEVITMIDSLEMTDDLRSKIIQSCQDSTEDKIVITHGTDTMDLTASKLAAAKIPKTIVLTGAMIPYKFGSSDGLFNLGSALAYSQALPHGVYVAMNGHFFHANNVKKDKTTGEFKTL